MSIALVIVIFIHFFDKIGKDTLMNTIFEDEALKEFDLNTLKEMNSSTIQFFIPDDQI